MSDNRLSPFESATRLEPFAPGRFRMEVPDGWQQGRGAFGGVVLGALARAMESVADSPEQRLRTLSGDIAAPVAVGPAEVEVRVLRRGANQMNVVAELKQDGNTGAIATAVLSAPRKAQAKPVTPSAPSLTPWEQIEPLPIGPPVGPVFAPHYLYYSSGPLPFAGGDEPITAGWIREKVVPSAIDAAMLMGYLDAWWPAMYSVEDTFRMAATISFMAEVLVDPAELDPAKPLGYTGRVEALSDGFAVEYRELWDEERLVALNQQTFALLK